MKDTAMLVSALAELDFGHFVIIGGFMAFIFREKIRSLWPSATPASNGNGAAKVSADRANTRLDAHEKECAHRHTETNEKFSVLFKRMNRVEKDLSFIRGAITTRWGIKPTDD